MTRSGSSRPIATLSLVLALVLAACGSQTSSPSPSTAAVADPTPMATPTASPTATAAPSPTPIATVDAAKPFLAVFTSARFAAHSKITGTIKLGVASYPITGSYDVNGSEDRQSVSIAIPGSPQVSESVTSAGVTYIQKSGLWYVKTAAPTSAGTDSTLASAMRSILDVVDVGIETRDGQSLHHLQPRTPTTIPVSTFGASDPNGDGKVTIDFYVQEDGTPVVMSLGMTWTQVSGVTRTPASMILDFEFSNVGGSIVITAPQQVWTTFKSKRFGYSMAYPDEWEVTASPKKDEPDLFISADERGVGIVRFPTHGYSLNTFTSDYLSTIKKESKGKVMSNQAATVDGSKARRIEFSANFDRTNNWHLDAVVVRGKFLYLVAFTSDAPLTAGDRAVFDALVSTVDLP